eukprot:6490628-Amphidinium_carterae.1
MLRPSHLPDAAPLWSPMGALRHWLGSLRLSLIQGWLVSTTGAQLYVGPSPMPLQEWKHALRSFLRSALWWQAGLHRRDHQGAEEMDVDAMLKSVRALEPQRQKVLTKILAGGLIVDERMHRWQQRQRQINPAELVTGICSYCTMGVMETERHLFWECPAWSRHRGMALPDSAPECFSSLGIPVVTQPWDQRLLQRYHATMIDIVIARAAMREDSAQVEEIRVDWKPLFRIRGKRHRDEIAAVGLPVSRDARGRLTRRTTNMDAFQRERDRLLQQLRDIPEPDPGVVPWPPMDTQRRQYTLFTKSFKNWYAGKPAHIVPKVRFLKGMGAHTGFLYWKCILCGAARGTLYKTEFLQQHLICDGITAAGRQPRLAAAEKVLVEQTFGPTLMDYPD